MKERALFLNHEGDISGICHIGWEGHYGHGDIVNDLLVQVVTSDLSDEELCRRYYYDFALELLVERPERPSPEHEWDKTIGAWVLNETLRLYKIAGMVNPVRDYIEASPVQVGEYWVDVDALSEKRMADALEFWQGPSITWTMADNAEVALTEGELETLYSQCRLVRAQRSMVLHTEARQLKSDLETTYEQVMDWQGQWLAGSPADPYYPPSL